MLATAQGEVGVRCGAEGVADNEEGYVDGFGIFEDVV